jgi:hypothetical protein
MVGRPFASIPVFVAAAVALVAPAQVPLVGGDVGQDRFIVGRWRRWRF